MKESHFNKTKTSVVPSDLSKLSLLELDNVSSGGAQMRTKFKPRIEDYKVL